MSYEIALAALKIKFQLCSNYPYCQYDGCNECKRERIPPLPKQTVFTLDELRAYRDSNAGKLSCDMVNWATSFIDDLILNSPNEIDKLKDFLKETYSGASPMWRQSHRDLQDKYGFK
jgi:hypothetical protein